MRENLTLRAVFGLTALWIPAYTAFWFYRGSSIKRDIEITRRDFQGDTPFYGRSWGYATDYMFEQTLSEGDLILLSHDRRTLSPFAAMRKTLLNNTTGVQWDNAGLIHVVDGQRYVVMLDNQEGFICKKYADFVAFSYADLIASRPLNVDNTTRKRIFDVIESLRSAPPALEKLSTFVVEMKRETINKDAFSSLKNLLLSGIELESRAVVCHGLDIFINDLQMLPSQVQNVLTEGQKKLQKRLEISKEILNGQIQKRDAVLKQLRQESGISFSEQSTIPNSMPSTALVPSILQQVGLLPRCLPVVSSWSIKDADRVVSLLPARLLMADNIDTALETDEFKPICSTGRISAHNALKGSALVPSYGGLNYIRQEMVDRYKLRKQSGVQRNNK